MMCKSQTCSEESLDDFHMQQIGNFLSFASRGDRVGLNQMLREGISPDVQDYDKRTALHLAASEGHAPIVELLVHYKANVNLKDRWHHTPLTDARQYGHRDICRILEVNGGIDIIDKPMTVRHEEDSHDVNIDISELNLQQSCIIEQGVFGESEKVKWRGTWVVKTVIKRQIQHPVKIMMQDIACRGEHSLKGLRHPNILQFLGSIVHKGEMILITEYLPKGNLQDILDEKHRLDLPTTIRYALDIARGMNYLHQHKPYPIVHNHLDPRNLLQDEGSHLKIGDYWVQMLYEQIHPNQEINQKKDSSGFKSGPCCDTRTDIRSFGFILYLMLEGRNLMSTDFDSVNANWVDFDLKFNINRCPKIIQQLIERCTGKDPSGTPDFSGVIAILERVSETLGKAACPVC